MQANISTSRKGAMFLRKSRADEEKERLGQYETLAKHERDLRELSERLKMPVDDVYRELESGNDLAHRDDFKLLMERVERREYAYVMVHAIDRLSRGDLMENGWILSTFQYSGTLIVTPSKVFDPANQMDLQQLQFMLLYSNVEYFIIKERLAAGKLASVRDGQYIAAVAPYGYDKHVTPDGKRTLVPNMHAPIVVEVFEAFAAGRSKGSIAASLNARGIKSPSGGMWRPPTLCNMVSNRTYMGMVTWGSTKMVVDGRDGIALRKRRIAGDDPVYVRGLHEAIVGEELWEAANAHIVHAGPRNRADRGLVNPLAGILRCAKCGRVMQLCRYGDGRHPSYRHQSGCGCNTRGCRADDVTEALADALSGMAGDLMVEAEIGDGGVAEHERRLVSLRGEMEAAERRRDKLVELYTEGALSLQDFRRRDAPIGEQLERLGAALAEEEAFQPVRPEQRAARLSELVAKIADDGLPPRERNDALRAVVERVDYERGEGKPKLTVYLR